MATDALGRTLIAVLAVASAACGRPSVPDPRGAAEAYARAVREGDADRVYSLLTHEAQRAYGARGVRTLIGENKAELGRQAQNLMSAPLDVDSRASYRLLDGEVAELSLVDGNFRVEAAGSVPMNPLTPAQALGELRRALAGRSYPALLRLLSVESQGDIERRIRGLVKGLEDPDALDVKIDGDTATAELPGGHRVKLKRDPSRNWRVDDIE